MQNNHLTHVEDLLFDETSKYTPLAIIEEMFEFVKGAQNYIGRVSIKWDGAPAFVCGRQNGEFFVGTKSVLSGNKAFAYTEEDIRELYPSSPGLQEKLIYLLKYGSKVITSGIYQGDMLWWPGSLEVKDDFISFKPNTLRYRIIHNTFSDHILNASIGVVIHTQYDENLQKLPTLETKDFQFSNEMFWMRPTFTPTVMDNEHETINFQFMLDTLFGPNWLLDYDVLGLLKLPKLNAILHKYLNHCVREHIDPESDGAGGFIFYYIDAWNAHNDTLKTEEGRRRYDDEMDGYYQSLAANEDELEKIFAFYGWLVRLKETLIRVMDRSQEYFLSISLPNGVLCGHEGYVIDSKLGTCKFVNRKVFSRANMVFENEWKGK